MMTRWSRWRKSSFSVPVRRSWSNAHSAGAADKKNFLDPTTASRLDFSPGRHPETVGGGPCEQPAPAPETSNPAGSNRIAKTRGRIKRRQARECGQTARQLRLNAGPADI